MIYEQDGDMICCHDEQFTNLQESLAGFGSNEQEALEDYAKNLLMSLGWRFAYLCGHGDNEVVTDGGMVIGDIEKSSVLVPPNCIWDEPEKIEDYF